VAIKQLGTNGGGYFGPNCTHPFENPTPWSNLVAMFSLVVLPMASLVMFGRMLKDRAHAWVVYGVMLAFLMAGIIVAVSMEVQPSVATDGLPVARGPNMEGKEVRLGAASGATWAAMTTATSNGSVNSMHDSLNPLAGLVPMANMMLNVVFSGIGAGFLNMLSYIIVAVFIAGLMVGRTPEYLSKKVEAASGPRSSRRRSGRRSVPTPARTDSARSFTSSARRLPTTARASRAWPITPLPGTSPPALSCCWAGSRP
jgi:K+-transporting ATPase ATPase A chain